MRIVVILGSLLISAFAAADHRSIPTAHEAEVLRLAPLVEEALGNNAELKAAQAENEVKEAQIGPAGSYEDPMLAIEAMNYPVDNFRPHEGGMTGNQVSLSQRFPFPGKLGKKREAAQHEAESQKEAARAKRLEIVKNVKLAYYELYLAYRKLDRLNEQKSILEQLTTVTRNNYALNKAPQAEVLTLQVETAGLVDQLLGMERQIRSRLGEINHLLGRSDHGQYVYGRPEEIKVTPFDFTKHSEKALLDLAFSRSPAVQEKKAKVASAESQLSFARRNYLPDFEIKLGYTFRQATRMDSGTDFVSGMIGLTLPLWAGSKQSEEKRGARAGKVRAEALLDEERIMLAHRIHVIYAEMEEAAKRMKLYEGGVLPLTRQAVVSARSAYLTGKLEYSTLLNTVNRRFQMEVSHAESIATYQSKLAEMEALVGESLGESP